MSGQDDSLENCEWRDRTTVWRILNDGTGRQSGELWMTGQDDSLENCEWRDRTSLENCEWRDRTTVGRILNDGTVILWNHRNESGFFLTVSGNDSLRPKHTFPLLSFSPKFPRNCAARLDKLGRMGREGMCRSFLPFLRMEHSHNYE